MNNLFENKKITQALVVIAVLSVAVFFLASAKNAMRGNYEGKVPATITVTGEGEFFAVPDTATFSFSVEKDGITQKDAKDAGAAIINTIIESLKKDYNMADKDLKTTNLSVNPKYEYDQPCYGYNCPARNPKVIGYTFSQSVTVKINNLDTAGEVAGKLAEWGATNVYGPEFTLADEDEANAKARQDAIVDAKVKAMKLSKQLGVRLGDIQSFSESNGGGMYPLAYGSMAKVEMAMDASVTPELPAGENKYVSNVTITYEIR